MKTTWSGGSSSVLRRTSQPCGDALDLVHDEDLAAQVRGGREDPRQQLAHVADCVVRGRVELVYVQGASFADGHARRAGVARLAVAQVGAVEGLRQDSGHRGLARAARPDEEVGVGGPARSGRRCAASQRRPVARRSGRRSGRASGGRWPGAVRSSSRCSWRRGRCGWRGSVRAPAAFRSAVHPPSIDRPRAHRWWRLRPGRSAAPDGHRLVLLPSGPDTVREPPLRGTRPSTSPRAAAFEDGDLGREFSPAGADCRYRAPLVPRLARPENHSSPRERSRRRDP